MFYIYLDGADFYDVEKPISLSIQQWLSDIKLEANFINHIFEKDSSYGPDDLPDWNLGINFEFNEANRIPEMLSSFILLLFLITKRLSSEFGMNPRTFLTTYLFSVMINSQLITKY